MTKQTIAVDIDDVLAASAETIVAFSNQEWGMQLDIHDYDENWGKMWGVDMDEEARRAARVNTADVFKTFTHDEAAIPVLRKLAKRYDLVVATSRTRDIFEFTQDWLDEHYPGIFSGVHLSGLYETLSPESHSGTKAQLLQEIGADYLIDDQIKHCRAVAEVGIKAILFGDFRWQRVIELPENVTRCKDWGEVERYFDGLETGYAA